MIPYLSIAWLLAGALLLFAAFQILRAWIGGFASGLAVAGLAVLPIALTAITVSPALAVRLPCPRNWEWLPTWQLRPSPMGSVSFAVGDTRVKVCYGRPASRGRRMIGGRYVPFGQLWRTGADEPTTIISTGTLEIAGVQVPAGQTSLYTVPGPETWEVILNRSTTQWGIESEYTDAIKAKELGRAILASETTVAPLERLTLFAEARPKHQGVDLTLRWESTSVRIPILPGSR